MLVKLNSPESLVATFTFDTSKVVAYSNVTVSWFGNGKQGSVMAANESALTKYIHKTAEQTLSNIFIVLALSATGFC